MTYQERHAEQVEALSKTVASYQEHRAECKRVAEILKNHPDDGPATTPHTKESTMSYCNFASVKEGCEYYAARVVGGHFIGKYIAIPARAIDLETKKILTKDPENSELVNSMLTVTRGYRAGRMCWPSNHKSYDITRHITAFPSLTDAREYATCVSIINPTKTVELASSNKHGNDTPYCVFHIKKAHASMNLISRYNNGCEELLKDAEMMQKFTSRAILPTWSVTYLDANNNEHNGMLQAASESEAWEIVYNDEQERDGSIVCQTSTRPVEIVQLDSGAKNEDIDRNLHRMYRDWSEDREDCVSLDPGYANNRNDAPDLTQQGAPMADRNRRIALDRIHALENKE
jgi:hypothetical protein